MTLSTYGINTVCEKEGSWQTVTILFLLIIGPRQHNIPPCIEVYIGKTEFGTFMFLAICNIRQWDTIRKLTFKLESWECDSWHEVLEAMTQGQVWISKVVTLGHPMFSRTHVHPYIVYIMIFRCACINCDLTMRILADRLKDKQDPVLMVSYIYWKDKRYIQISLYIKFAIVFIYIMPRIKITLT